MDHHILHSLRQAFVEPQLPTQTELPISPGDVPRIPEDCELAVSQPNGRGLFALVELILKDPVRLDRQIRQTNQQIELLPRLLATSLAAFAIFGVAMTLVLSAAGVWPHLFPIQDVLAGKQIPVLRFESNETASFLSPWWNGDAFRLIAAYSIGLIGATGICLPSLYFYGLLAGIRMTMMDVVIHAVKSKAVAAITLIGIIPIYAAFGLATAIFPLPDVSRDTVLLFGLLLPFIAGFAGTYSLYRGLSTLTDTITPERREHRECFLQRLVVSWCGVYSAVSPVLIFTLWQRMQG